MSYTQNAQERIYRTGAHRVRHSLHASPRHRRATVSAVSRALSALTRSERLAVAWAPLLAAAIVFLCEVQVRGWTL